jgi:hypothetical protein
MPETKARAETESSEQRAARLAYHRDWHARNRDAELAKKRSKYKADPEKAKQYRKERYERDREKILAWNKEYYQRTRSDRLATMRAWRDKNPDHHHKHKLRYRYGLSSSDYEVMLLKQGGGCGICGAAPKHDRRLSVDHDHDTGAVRGLLCDACNQAIGLLRDDPRLLKNAIEYLGATNAS